MRSIKLIGISTVAALAAVGFFAYQWAQAGVTWETDLRKPKNPETYGNVVLDRNASNADMRPVVFPHWVHRNKFACKVCHTDLGFSFKAGTAEITMADIFAGKQCGTCHNGDIAFAPFECDKCHSYGLPQDRNMAERLKDHPKDYFGNKVDWVKALETGASKAAANPDGTDELFEFDMDIIIPTTKFKPSPPDVKYPHNVHTRLLDCTSCHESIFKQQQGGNPEMNMMKIISGQYCGVCHNKVAFPINDCFRCHSQPAPVIEDPDADKEGKEEGEAEGEAGEKTDDEAESEE